MLIFMKEGIDYFKKVVQSQINMIKDPIVKEGLQSILVEPTNHLRHWDYSGTNETFECWTVAVDNNSDTSLIYCEKGFGPKCPWGLVATSFSYFGMDSGWYSNLEECYLESYHAGDLKIWNIEKRIDSSTKELIAENLTSNEGFKLIDTLCKSQVNKYFYIFPRKFE